ncbi:mapk-regulated corepressor-interacting protein 1 isoform X6 [Crotalus tigris]|uniref:mapk-regulated corepressor-interacting protein 1 isoform X5 n=1 Tax=Crotalus tigris TaxID=88082 RepID=UPI00192F28B2|nr:mapk-regulated corepressor-interacting protein 1 isoform X5 [Crotalus tigris]XP_039200825.1 mapk-regulated corepressor-interacting protein 1 isoform X6 [Crotalus tigris]
MVLKGIVAKIYAKRFYYTHLCLPVAMDFLQWTATVVGYFSVVIFHLKTEVKCFIPVFQFSSLAYNSGIPRNVIEEVAKPDKFLSTHKGLLPL